MPENGVLNITPTPRILRMLGEIPFQTWQCIAELIDNSIDAFMSENTKEDGDREKIISVSWTNESAAAHNRTIEITDNACGMNINQLQNAVKAGYSGNDPIGNLGLFGMGFNISTARLGELTTILSTRSGDTEWIGIEIDFQKLIDSKSFNAPVIRVEKENPSESGTKIKISRLRQGILAELPNKESEIRQRLEAIYSPLLNQHEISIIVRGKQLNARSHCVWSESRYVRYNEQNVSARIEIDRNLGDALFDLNRNCYLTGDEAEPYYMAQQEGNLLPSHIVERGKRLTGWLGIQRYADPNDFGIDFIRNGRKILVSDKSLFQYENPYTGQNELQYPVELGSTVGGRIVGELNVDYLLPTYQKNGFDKSDSSWSQTVEAICGVGPFLPKSRKSYGFTEPNNSPLCILANAYRRVDKGTRCLFAPSEIAKTYAAQFKKNIREYIDDSLWWKAAQEEDQKQNTGGGRSTPVNTGNTPSDDISDYLPGLGGTTPTQTTQQTDETPDTGNNDIVAPAPPPVPETSGRDELIQRSNSVAQLSGNYKFGNTPLKVRAYELKLGQIFEKGNKKPCAFFPDGTECDFFYNPQHPLLNQYPITPKMLLLQYLASRLMARDQLTDIVATYATLVEESMPEAKIDRQSLQDRAISAFDLLREKLVIALQPRAIEVLDCIHESVGEVEDTIGNIQSNAALILAFQSREAGGFDALYYVPPKTLLRLVEKFPDDVFDGKVLSTPYSVINLSDANATKRSRDESKERALAFLKDALRVIVNTGYGQRDQKNELARASLSVDFLLKELE
ncbi:MAG: ATP-binding protein [Oscillospiraceae bacterium]|jgi:hypothetical protein|nr:ATP-binding protein [Oscillospiraceae bacterium]